MKMPEPTPGHARMAALAGNWEGEETMFPSQWDPVGGTATGRSNSRLDLGGFAVITDYEQERDGKITFTGHGVMTYDPKRETYVMYWVDCMGSPPEVFEGRFDGDVLAMGHGGPGMHARMTYDLTDPSCLRSWMEMSHDGKTWNKLFEARYTRR